MSENDDDDGVYVVEALIAERVVKHRGHLRVEYLTKWQGYDEALSKWVAGAAEKTWVSYPEFTRFAAKNRAKLKLSEKIYN